MLSTKQKQRELAFDDLGVKRLVGLSLSLSIVRGDRLDKSRRAQANLSGRV